MSVKLFFIRRTKGLFLKMNLHVLFNPFVSFFLNAGYLTKLSAWRKSHSNLKFNDFYSGKWNYNARYDLYKFTLTEENLNTPVNYMEFGVSQGYSFKWWLENIKNADAKFYGFDTFTGLPEDWGGFDKGAMSAKGNLPVVNDDRAKFLKGLFQETLPDFLKSFDTTKKNVLMMDADLYTSTLYVLTSFAPFLKRGDVIFFDQFAVPTHEFLAFTNFIDSFYFNYEVIGAANNYYFLALKII